MGNAKSFMASVFRVKVVDLKIDAWASTPIPYPLYCELTISRMKRGGVEVIRAGHIF